MKLHLQTHTPVDGRVIAQENELKVLKAVNLFGHLRRAEIAAAVWPKSSPLSAEAMVRRTVKRLLETGELLERPNSLGGLSLILSPRGATKLNLEGLEADDGKNLSSVEGPQFYHRTLGSRYLVEKMNAGAEVFGEYALIKGRAPVSRAQMSERFHKYPDGLAVYPGEQRHYQSEYKAADWIEVESAFKADDDYEKLISIAWKVGSFINASEDCILDRLVFVFDVRQRHENAILSYLRRTVASNLTDESMAILRSIILVRVRIKTPLVWEGYEEIVASDALQLGAQ
jgi:hypothetical protein